MNWYLQSGKESDVVTSTRIRFARNLSDFKFEIKDKEQLEQLEEKMQELCWNIGYGLKYFKLRDMDDMTKMSLVEKNLISPEFAFDKEKIGSIMINDEENICITINDEEHIRIQIFSSGLDLENSLNLAKEIDRKIGDTISYAINKKYGYLTTYPTNVGTGLRASLVLHLPGITKTKNISKILNTVNSFGVIIKGVYGDNGKSSGDMYQISNKQTLGVTEEEIIRKIKIIAEKIVEQEREIRKFLAKDSIMLVDKIYRSFGILSNCKKITLKEARELLSETKLGVDLGILKELDDKKILKLFLYTKPSNLQKYFGEQYDNLARDIKRAEVIKQIINEQ